MDDGTISRISYAYSHRRKRGLPPTSEVEELHFVIVSCKSNVKTEKHLMGWKNFKNGLTETD
jgi:hypothetical protein